MKNIPETDTLPDSVDSIAIFLELLSRSDTGEVEESDPVLPPNRLCNCLCILDQTLSLELEDRLWAPSIPESVSMGVVTSLSSWK